MLPTHRVDGPAGAPVLVLAGSLGSTSAMWEPQVLRLVERFRVVRWEHRGHAGAVAPGGPYAMADLGGDVVDLLDHLGVERAALCGLSLGAMVSLWVASHHPERVDRLVLSGAAAHLPPPSAWAERAATVRAHGPGVLAEALLSRWFTPGYLERHPEAAAAVRSWLAAADPEGYAGCCEALGGMDQRRALSEVQAPTLVVTGAGDPVATPAVALGLHEAIAGSALVVVADAAHLANVEQPDRFTDALLGHLAGSPPERGRRALRAVLGDRVVARSTSASLGLPAGVRACLFDLDGVLTSTASLHAAAWKETFDELLGALARESGVPFEPFTMDDYNLYVDGRPRSDGVRAFVASRSIDLPEGGEEDPPTAWTVHGVAAAKNRRVLGRIRSDGVDAYAGSLRYLAAVRRAGVPSAVVSASANTTDVLTAAGLDDRFGVQVDGLVVARLGLRGKPAPDPYLEAARQLGVAPADAAVFEDALAGVEAARAGGFGYVVGVNRLDPEHGTALAKSGADVVVSDLGLLLDDENAGGGRPAHSTTGEAETLR